MSEEAKVCKLKVVKESTGFKAKMVCGDEEKEVSIEKMKQHIENIFNEIQGMLNIDVDEIVLKKGEERYNLKVMSGEEEIAEGEVKNEELNKLLDEVFE